jgi:hypothetical protein
MPMTATNGLQSCASWGATQSKSSIQIMLLAQ